MITEHTLKVQVVWNALGNGEGTVWHRIVLPGWNLEDGYFASPEDLALAGIHRPKPAYEPKVGDTVQVNWSGNMNDKMYGVVSYVDKYVEVDLGVRTIRVTANFLDKVEK